MSFKAALAALACCASAPVAAAQVEVGGLEGVNPWGRSYLSEGEPGWPPRFWRASLAGDLLPLMNQARTRGLTPAERLLLRRVVLSPGEPPSGEKAPELLAERARLMFELGEAEAAADLMATLDVSPVGFNAGEVAADLSFALGEFDTVCDTAPDKAAEGGFWLRILPACQALRGDQAAAELAIELAESQGVSDPWLWSAVLALSGDAPQKPPAKLDSGLALAVSDAAGLESDENAAATSRPDLAAAIARRDALPPELRVQAAGVAAENGLITPETHRAVYEALAKADGFEPGAPIEGAVAGALDGVPAETLARDMSSALRSAQGDAARFAAVSRLLAADIENLPKRDSLAPQALGFARAALAAGAPGEALAWASFARGASSPDVDAFEAAWVQGLAILAGADVGSDEAGRIGRAMMDAAAGDARRLAAVKLFSLWTVFDTPPPPQARALMAAEREAQGEAVSPGAVLSILSAAEADAAGEAALRILSYTRGDPSDLDMAALTIMLRSLQVLGADDAARLLALEATGYWKSAL